MENEGMEEQRRPNGQRDSPSRTVAITFKIRSLGSRNINLRIPLEGPQAAQCKSLEIRRSRQSAFPRTAH